MKVSEAQAIIDYYHSVGLISDDEAKTHGHNQRYSYWDKSGYLGKIAHARSDESRRLYMAKWFGAEAITI